MKIKSLEVFNLENGYQIILHNDVKYMDQFEKVIRLRIPYYNINDLISYQQSLNNMRNQTITLHETFCLELELKEDYIEYKKFGHPYSNNVLHVDNHNDFNELLQHVFKQKSAIEAIDRAIRGHIIYILGEKEDDKMNEEWEGYLSFRKIASLILEKDIPFKPNPEYKKEVDKRRLRKIF